MKTVPSKVGYKISWKQELFSTYKKNSQGSKFCETYASFKVLELCVDNQDWKYQCNRFDSLSEREELLM